MSEAINTRVDAKPTDPMVSMRQSIDKATNDAEAAGVLPGKIRDHVSADLLASPRRWFQPRHRYRRH
jgi:hypothetical protein